jgi:hypothetical protein
MDAHPTLLTRADGLAESAWKCLQRREKYTTLTGVDPNAKRDVGSSCSFP